MFDALEKIVARAQKIKHPLAKNAKKLLALKKAKFEDNLKKDLKLCFSSTGNKGYWDIATMSMRKIKSCMTWGSDNSIALIGSILDPYVGIIYITDGTHTNHGKSMIARSVVRFVVDRNGKPSIFLERVYADGLADDYADVFKSFIEERVDIPVCSDDDEDQHRQFVIPLTEQVSSIADLALEEYLSYRDSDIEYGSIQKYSDPTKIKL